MAKKAVVTGAGGLVGSAAVEKLSAEGWEVHGIDNDNRKFFFGEEGSTANTFAHLNCAHYHNNISDDDAMAEIFEIVKPELVIHTAAQPSHDRAAQIPYDDFDTNATGTLVLMQTIREICPTTVFCHISTSKVYGDTPNTLPLKDTGSRLDLHKTHPFYHGITTDMRVDRSLHSLFGVSKLAGDLVVQEYGRYFGIPTVIFRPGCVTGARHSAVELHGFLNYLVKCAVERKGYKIIGYGGKQVRCNIDAYDLVEACMHFRYNPKPGSPVYNIGGGRAGACSINEAIKFIGGVTGKAMVLEYVDEPRVGDHKWWISDNRPFEKDYPAWELTKDWRDLVMEIYNGYNTSDNNIQ